MKPTDDNEKQKCPSCGGEGGYKTFYDKRIKKIRCWRCAEIMEVCPHKNVIEGACSDCGKPYKEWI